MFAFHRETCALIPTELHFIFLFMREQILALYDSCTSCRLLEIIAIQLLEIKWRPIEVCFWLVLDEISFAYCRGGVALVLYLWNCFSLFYLAMLPYRFLKNTLTGFIKSSKLLLTYPIVQNFYHLCLNFKTMPDVLKGVF